MFYSGQLKLKASNDNYGIYTGDRFIDISEILDKHYKAEDHIHIKILDSNDNKLVNKTGILHKHKVSKSYYLYYLDEIDIDNILWNLVEKKVSIFIKTLNNKNIIFKGGFTLHNEQN